MTHDTHDVVLDTAGWKNYPRLTCYSCGATLLRAPWMSNPEWLERVQLFEQEHPSETVQRYRANCEATWGGARDARNERPEHESHLASYTGTRFHRGLCGKDLRQQVSLPRCLPVQKVGQVVRHLGAWLHRLDLRRRSRLRDSRQLFRVHFGRADRKPAIIIAKGERWEENTSTKSST